MIQCLTLRRQVVTQEKPFRGRPDDFSILGAVGTINLDSFHTELVSSFFGHFLNIGTTDL